VLDHYWGDNLIHLHSEYIGVAVILLAILAFAKGRPLMSRKLVWFFTGVTIIAVLWALGGYTPFYRLVYAIVPGTKFFRAPSTMLYVISFGIAVLAAFGAERAVHRDVSRRYLIGCVIAVLGIGVIGATGGLTNLGVSLATPEQLDRVMANDGALRVGALRSTLFGALALTCLFMLATGRLGREAGGYLLAGIVAVDLWSVERTYWQFSQPASVIFASDSTIAYIQAQPDPGRVLTYITRNESARDPFLRGDALMDHRIRNVLGYHGNELGRFQQLGGGAPQYPMIANPNFWHLMNVRYILTDAEDLGIPGLNRVVGPVQNAYGSTVFLYQLTDTFPAAFVTPAIVKATDDEMLGTVLDPRFDVTRAGLFDTAAAVKGVQLTSLPAASPITARTTRFDPGAIDVELDQPAIEGNALIVSENYYPGWTATVDGKPATIGRADMSLIGVELPVGARKIELRFDSPPYHTGKKVTLVALLLATAWWVGGAFVGKVRRA
jgi:hypothetical protein